MKNDVVMYERIYGILKNKIECGLLPQGTKLPSRADLCKEFGCSEKTVRSAIKLLAQEGLVETNQRKRPIVAYEPLEKTLRMQRTLQQADTAKTNDMLMTGILLCYPLNRHGMQLCQGTDWAIADMIVEKMDPQRATEFWRLSNRLWRFFIARNGNELILRAVDCLGFADVDPLPGTLEMRERYHLGLSKLLQTMKQGGDPESVHFDELFVLYDVLLENQGQLEVLPNSPLRSGTKGIGQRLRRAQERYSSVGLNLLSLIVEGTYQFGERLPSYEELQTLYEVSIDTVVKAVQLLQQWGAVKAIRGKGIFVSMTPKELQAIYLEPQLLACHLRRLVDSLEFLYLTVEGVADYAATQAKPQEALALYQEIEALAQQGPYQYQLASNRLLDFLVSHLHYEALRDIYEMVRENYWIGKAIPQLMNRAKDAQSRWVYQQCEKAAEFLAAGDGKNFAKQTAAIYQYIYQWVVAECQRLGYWEAAAQVYDGDALWK